jgi:hypothetical protein
MTQPPIVPGPTGTAPTEPDPASELTGAPQQRRGPVIAIIAVGAVLTVVVAGAVVWALTRDGSPLQQKTALRQAYEDCNHAGVIDDSDRTLFLDLKGEEPGSGVTTTIQLACVLSALEAPSYVTRAMESTRALDGRVTETWDGFEATWTYHPDEGLDVLIRELDE